MYERQTPPGQSGPPDQHDQAAIVLAVAAAFLWANPLYEMTHDYFRQIAIRNYGYEPLRLLEIAYLIGIHVGVFVLSRVAFRWALMVIVTSLGYRLALSFQ